jgi:hypothetical protein
MPARTSVNFIALLVAAEFSIAKQTQLNLLVATGLWLSMNIPAE